MLCFLTVRVQKMRCVVWCQMAGVESSLDLNVLISVTNSNSTRSGVQKPVELFTAAKHESACVDRDDARDGRRRSAQN